MVDSMTPSPQPGYFDQLPSVHPLVQDEPRLLFRVFTPRRLQQEALSDADYFFVSGAFDSLPDLDGPSTSSVPVSYHDVVSHLDWATRGNESPFISATSSFSWALWEAYKRRHVGVKHDVHIAVIDADEVATLSPLDVLAACPVDQQHPSHAKWCNTMHNSQTVLVHGCITKRAVMASLPLNALLDALPAYMQPDQLSEPHAKWLGTTRKPSFSSFSRELSARFLDQHECARLHAATTGAMRLACAFLRPWLSRITADRDLLVATVSSLALDIAHWPASAWTEDHPEVQHILEETSCLLIDHLLEDRREREAMSGHLEDAIEDLERIIDGYRSEFDRRVLSPIPELPELIRHDSDFDARSDFDDHVPGTPSTLYEFSPLEGKGFESMSLDEGVSIIEAGSSRPAPSSALDGPATSLLHVIPAQLEPQRSPSPTPVVLALPLPLPVESLPSPPPVPAPRRKRSSPSVVEQASVATLFFIISAFATLFAARAGEPLPLAVNVT